jgi:hypothetical protein
MKYSHQLKFLGNMFLSFASNATFSVEVVLVVVLVVVLTPHLMLGGSFAAQPPADVIDHPLFHVEAELAH